MEAIIKTKRFASHIELVKFGSNRWSMRDYVYPSFQKDHKYWWFCGILDKEDMDSKWIFTMKEEDKTIMTYLEVITLAKMYDKFLDESEWF